MRKNIFLFILFIFIPAILLADNWVEIQIPSVIRNNFIPAEVFVVNNHVILTGSTRYGGFATAISSHDNGATWQTLSIPSLNMLPNGFNVGILGTYCVLSSYHGNEKISAIDENNIEWGMTTAFGYPFYVTQGYVKLFNNKMYVQAFFPGQSIGKLVAINKNNSYNVLSEYIPGVLRYMSFLDSNNVFCISDTIIGASKNTWLYRSSDGGQTWLATNWLVGSSVSDDIPCKIQWVNDYVGFLSCKAGLHKTTNGGISWNQINQLPGDICGFFFLNSDEGYLVTNFWGIQPTLLKTTNGGVLFQWPEIMTFNIGTSGFQGYSGDVLSGDDQNVVLVTDSVIYRLDRLTNIQHENTPINFKLNQNYPNPFNPTTKISYSVPKSSFVTIKVYDISGKEVSTLVNQEHGAGKYEAVFNGSKLCSGTYFYVLTAGDFAETKKMLLIK